MLDDLPVAQSKNSAPAVYLKSKEASSIRAVVLIARREELDSLENVEIDPVSAKLAATEPAPARRHGSHGRKVREPPPCHAHVCTIAPLDRPRPSHPHPPVRTAHLDRTFPPPPPRQDHRVFAQHTFEVPKNFLNNNKAAAKCALKVADKMVDRYEAKMTAKKAAKKAATKQMSTKAAADKKITSQLAAPEVERAPPSKSAKATAAVKI